MKTILAGVSTIRHYDIVTGDLMITSRTLTDSSATASATELEIRGGAYAPLIGSYFHTTGLAIESTESVFDLNYLALKFGSQISIGGTDFSVETVTTTLNTITVVGTPVEFASFGKIGWYKLENETDDQWKKITFVGKVATITIATGTIVCVKFNTVNDALKEIKIPTNMIPSVTYAIMESDLFRCTETGKVDTTSSKVGKLIVEIPQFQFNPNMAISLTMAGVGTMAVGGKALSNQDNSCEDNGGYYAKIKEIIIGAKWYDEIVELALGNDNLDLITGEVEPLQVFALYKGGTYKQIDNSKFVFTSSEPSIATTVGGEVSWVSVGTANVTVSIAEKPSVTTTALVVCS